MSSLYHERAALSLLPRMPPTDPMALLAAQQGGPPAMVPDLGVGGDGVPNALRAPPMEVPPGIARVPGAPPPPQAPPLQVPQMGAPRLQDPAPLGPAPRSDVTTRPGDVAQPDFEARPDGEAEMEAYLFGQMVLRGNRAPQAMQNSWRDIQTAKRSRITQRATYQADLIKERHRQALMQNREADRYDVENERAVMGEIMANRRQEADMKMRARQFNIEARFRARQIDAAEKANALKQLDYDYRLREKTLGRIEPELSSAISRVNTLDRLSTALERNESGNAFGRVGGGWFGNMPQRAMRAAGVPFEDRASLERVMKELELVRTDLLNDSRISEGERRLLREGLPSLIEEGPERFREFIMQYDRIAKNAALKTLRNIREVDPVMYNNIRGDYEDVFNAPNIYEIENKFRQQQRR